MLVKSFLTLFSIVQSHKTVKIQALSSGSDVLNLVGKNIDFSADQTFIGEDARGFVKVVLPGVLNSINKENVDSLMAWCGDFKLGGFDFASMVSNELNLTK